MIDEDDEPQIEVEAPGESWQYTSTHAYGLGGGLDAFCEAVKAFAIRLRLKDGLMERLDSESLQWVELGKAPGKIRLVKGDEP